MATKRILLVEDEPAIARLVEFKLCREGYRVTCVEDGEAALTALAEETKFDLLLLDVLMPKLNGFQVLERLKRDPASGGIPVIMLTAKGQGEDIATGTKLGANDYIIKPFNLDVLVERVERILEASDGPGEDTAGR